MNIIVPLGGVGKRFQKNSDLAKPLIPIHNIPMVQLSVDHFVKSMKLKDAEIIKKIKIIYEAQTVANFHFFDLADIVPRTILTKQLYIDIFKKRM